MEYLPTRLRSRALTPCGERIVCPATDTGTDVMKKQHRRDKKVDKKRKRPPTTTTTTEPATAAAVVVAGAN